MLYFLFQVVTVPFPFQSLMKLLLVSMTSGLLLYASPGIAAAILSHPLKADEMYLSLLVTMVTSILIPLIFRLVFFFLFWYLVYNTMVAGSNSKKTNAVEKVQAMSCLFHVQSLASPSTHTHTHTHTHSPTLRAEIN